MKYNFLKESNSATRKISNYFFPNGVEKFLNYSAAGTLMGTTIGGVAGLGAGYYMYKTKRKTLNALKKKILSPNISAYAKRNLIDEKNMIESMSEREYREYSLKKFYKYGTAIGSFAGTAIGAALSRKK